MLIKTYGAAVQGIDALIVTVEAFAETGFSFSLVGMADTAVKESYQRVQSAIMQSGYKWPRRRLVVNLSPADVRKEGAAYDLPIAIGVLASCEQISPAIPLDSFMFMGELSLDGSLLPIKGALPMAIKARELGFRGMIVPVANATEAAVVNNLEVYGMSSLREVIDFVTGMSVPELGMVKLFLFVAFGSSGDDKDSLCGRETEKRLTPHDRASVPLASPQYFVSGFSWWWHKPCSGRDFPCPQRSAFSR